jgi:glycerophosphoryl diester phosphodiesterase
LTLRGWGRAGGVTVVGHRGGRGAGWPPENTLAAFEKARSQGAHAVELDVRLCRSGEVVVVHDRSLARVTGNRETRDVADLSFRVLASVELGEGQTVPRLDDVLAWSKASGCALNVELKHDVPDRVALVRAVARSLRGSGERPLVSSFDPLILVLLRAFAPEVPRALLTDPSQHSARALHALARPLFIAALHVERRQASWAGVARWKRRGLTVGVWTVNDPSEARQLRDAGVDLLISDEPGRVLDAIA